MKEIQAILAKLAKGETLTDAEAKTLQEFDLQKAIDGAAKAARTEAEAKTAKAQEELDKLKTKVGDLTEQLKTKDDSSKTELQKAQDQIKELNGKFAEMQKKAQEQEAAAAALTRKQNLRQIREKAGIKFAEGIDPEILEDSFSRNFDGIEDLSDEAVIQEKVSTWTARNKGAILDTSGHGTGGAHPNQQHQPSAVSTADRAKQLREERQQTT